MFYTIYKITDLSNGKTYIGKHQTRDLNDDYFGSGKLLQHIVKKHGLKRFSREILEVYNHEWQMNLAERILVVVDKDISYNLNTGGCGSWDNVNRNTTPEEAKRKTIAARKEYRRKYPKGAFAGRSHSSDTIMLMSGPRPQVSGSKNSQFGSMWITDGVQSKKIKKVDIIPNGWYKGRVIAGVA